MTIRFACPDCRRQFQYADDAARKRVRCPDCGRPIDVPAMGSIVRFFGRMTGDGLASAPILLGGFALFFCWVPILGVMMAVPLALIGIAFGVLGFPIGLLRSRKAMMRSLGGIGLCVLTIVGSFVSTGALIAYLKNASIQAGLQQQQVAPVFAPSRPGPRDNRVMTIDGHRADEPPQADVSRGPLPARMPTSSESATQRKISDEKRDGGNAARQTSPSGRTTRDR